MFKDLASCLNYCGTLNSSQKVQVQVKALDFKSIFVHFLIKPNCLAAKGIRMWGN